MRRTVTVVGLATGLVLTAGGSYASAPGNVSDADRSQAQGFSVSADGQARKCIGRKAIRRARVFVSVKRLNHIIGKKGEYWAGTHRVWDVCNSSMDLSAYVVKKKGKLRVFDIEAPKARLKSRVAPAPADVRTDDDGARRCVTKKTIKRKIRPYMTYRKATKVLGSKGRVTSRNWRSWDGCFGGDFTLWLYRANGKRRVYAINAVDASYR